MATADPSTPDRAGDVPAQHPVPVTILTGFLGSGKTTLLNALLAAPHGVRLAVIINEFGQIGVDGAQVSGGAQFVELDNGCLCCALNDDLVTTLHALEARGGFDHVVVETTGMADPLPVAWSFTRPGLSQAYRVDAIVTVVDAASVDAALSASTEAADQIARADLLALTKLDLVADDGAAAAARVREHNAVAPLLRARGGQLPWDMVLSQGAAPQAMAPGHGHRASFTTYSHPIDTPVSEDRLYDLCAELPPSVYRLKGFVHTDAPWDWMLVNVVAGRIDLRPARPLRAVRPGLVFIGPRLNERDLAVRCRGLVAASARPA